MENKNVEKADCKLFMAIVSPYQGKGEEKLILHEATVGDNGEVTYGAGNILVVDPSAVLRIDSKPIE